MKLSKERKIYVTIGAAAALGLAIDRLAGGAVSSPEIAAASLTVARTSPAMASAAANEFDVAALNLRSDRSLPARLEIFAQDEGYDLRSVEDGFSTTGGWLNQAIETGPDKPGARSDAQKLAEEFQARHKLTALMTGAEGGLAVVNGVPLRPGQEIGSFKLVAIQGNQAVFECQGRAAILELTIDPGKLLKRKSP